MWEVEEPPRAQPAPQDAQILDLEARIEELNSQLITAEELRQQLEQERRDQERKTRERQRAEETQPKPEPEGEKP